MHSLSCFSTFLLKIHVNQNNQIVQTVVAIMHTRTQICWEGGGDLVQDTYPYVYPDLYEKHATLNASIELLVLFL